MQPMAARLGVDHQALQQFVTSSTWDYEVVRRNVARWAIDAIDPAAYVIDDTGFPKDGTASPCVARQYSGTLGKTGKLPDRRQRAAGHRYRVTGGELAAVLPRRVGRGHDQRCGQGRRRTNTAH
jgi:hypothetical protein